MGNGLASFAAGFGGGYLNAKRQGELDQERQADRAMRQQEFDARIGEVNERKDLRMSLADAARPVTVESGAGGMIRPETMDNRDVGLPENASQPNNGLSLNQFRVKGKTFETQAQADTAAANQNTPDAVAQRQGLAYRQAGRPDQALDIEQKQAQITAAQSAQARKLKDEGVFNAVRALRAGDASGVAMAFNEGGQYKIDGVPVMTQEDRDIPGVGKMPTYTAKLRMIGPDGKVVEKTYNSHDLSMQMMPYEKALELQRKGSDSDNKFTYQSGMLDAKGKQIELQSQLGAARVAAASAKGSGGGASGGGKIQSSRVDADGFMVGVFRDGSARRLTDQDGKPIRADSAAKRVDSLAKTLKDKSREYRRMPDDEVRKAAESILFGGGDEAPGQPAPAATPAPGLASARPSTSTSTRAPAPAPAPATQSARDSDQRFILENEMAKAKQRLASGDTRAQGDIDSLGREISRLPGSKPAAPGLANSRTTTAPNPFNASNPASAKPAAPAQAGYSHLWK